MEIVEGSGSTSVETVVKTSVHVSINVSFCNNCSEIGCVCRAVRVGDCSQSHWGSDEANAQDQEVVARTAGAQLWDVSFYCTTSKPSCKSWVDEQGESSTRGLGCNIVVSVLINSKLPERDVISSELENPHLRLHWLFYHQILADRDNVVARKFLVWRLLIFGFQFRSAFQPCLAILAVAELLNSSCGLELWLMTLTFELHQGSVEINQHTRYLG